MVFFLSLRDRFLPSEQIMRSLQTHIGKRYRYFEADVTHFRLINDKRIRACKGQIIRQVVLVPRTDLEFSYADSQSFLSFSQSDNFINNFFSQIDPLLKFSITQKCTVQKIDRAIFDSSNPDSYVFLFTVRLLSRPISPTKGGLQKKFTTISFEPFPVIVCHNNSHYYSRWGRLSL